MDALASLNSKTRVTLILTSCTHKQQPDMLTHTTCWKPVRGERVVDKGGRWVWAGQEVSDDDHLLAYIPASSPQTCSTDAIVLSVAS